MNDFDQLIQDIEQEAQAEGPAAIAELRAFDDRFRIAAMLMQTRKQKGFTQAELASASGVQQADISRIERGEVEPRASTLARLLAPLDHRISIEEIEVERAPGAVA